MQNNKLQISKASRITGLPRLKFHPKLWLLFLIVITATTSFAKPIAYKIGKNAATVLYKRAIYLELTAKSKSIFQENRRKFTSVNQVNCQKYRRKNGFVFPGQVYRFPFNQLSCTGKRTVIKKLFPKDKLTIHGWEHRITFSGENGETLWRLAKWFTGSGKNASSIQIENKVNPKRLYRNHLILIPFDILDQCFHIDYLLPIKVAKLTYKEDNEGLYAEYILRYRQTIYSDIVLQYTPRINAKEVMNAAKIILKRSSLDSFTEIPANTAMKIPFNLISPEFYPPLDPRRIQYEKTLLESLKFKKKIRSSTLKNVTIVLDAGHGGVDPGTIGAGNEHEDEYVFDIMARIKLILEQSTQAKVYTTTADDKTGFTPRNSAYLPGNSEEKILTHPPYLITNSRIALNLRFFLANHLLRQHLNSDLTEEQIIFSSFHADSLHPNANGLMIYIPGADYYCGKCKKTQKVYTSRFEVQKYNSVQSTRKEKLKAEGFSRNLANHLIEMCKTQSIPIHSNKPIRKYIIRDRNTWVPGLLCYCKIPTRILIELVNLNNETDRKRLRNVDFRQKIAEVYVDAIKAYYKDNSS